MAKGSHNPQKPLRGSGPTAHSRRVRREQSTFNSGEGQFTGVAFRRSRKVKTMRLKLQERVASQGGRLWKIPTF
ncbi:MAG: hypothetical protein ACXWP5_06035 [Bdellovibrionota bacterium]